MPLRRLPVWNPSAKMEIQAKPYSLASQTSRFYWHTPQDRVATAFFVGLRCPKLSDIARVLDSFAKAQPWHHRIVSLVFSARLARVP